MRPILVPILSLATLLPAPAAALQYCEELWFTRNLVFHRAGYCFGSPLGKAVFGNAGCIGTSVEPDPAEAPLVAEVRRLEQLDGCRVDTTVTSLPIPLLKLRKALVDIPLPSPFESSCFNWRAGALPLFSARHRDSPVFFVADTGDDLLFEFEPAQGWQYVEVLRGGSMVGAGWTDAEMAEGDCEGWAG